MSYMKTGVLDTDGKAILASCPFYTDNPLCVNSCAVFLPLIHTDKETGEKFVDFNFGWCGMAGRKGNLLSAISPEAEATIRRDTTKRKKSYQYGFRGCY